jgi:hypothetical protein
MNKIKFFAFWILLAGIALFGATAAAQDEDDPPSRVARMNFSQGSVSFQPGGEGDWVSAVPNRPLTTGDNLWTDRNSRAELHVGSTSVRMGPETSLTFLQLDDRTAQFRLSDGSMIVRVRHLDDDDLVEVDTPNAAFSVLKNGEYRIDVDRDGEETFVTAWRGRGEVTGGGSSYVVVGGQRARFFGMDSLNYDISEIPRSDDFDDWAFDRDGREDRADSSNYVSQEMTGYEDLDDYGRWRYVSDYGPVWIPASTPVGWAPYRYGHWVWIRPWGWTWVDDEPWGFAPFHYGRWAYVENGWCWVPGPVVVRPVYAPALVVFVGDQRRFGGGPGVGWFPLAPGEVFVPAYRVSRVYVNRVNVTNTVVNVTKVTNVYNTYITNKTNVTQINYINRRAPNAVTAVSRQTFVNARPVAKNIVRVSDRDVAEAPVTHTAPAEPVKASVLGAGVPVKNPPPQIVNRPVIARKIPAPSQPRFEQRENPISVEREQPVNHGQSEVARPQPPSRPSQPNQPEQTRQVPRPPQPNQPEQTRQVPRPEAVRPEEPVRPQEPVRAERPIGVPRPAAPVREGQPRNERPEQPESNFRRPEAPERPLVRPAPPVQEKSPAQMREEQSKFNGWEQRHEQMRPSENRPAPAENRAAPAQARPTPPNRAGSPEENRPPR